jgi:hypothetical protein
VCSTRTFSAKVQSQIRACLAHQHPIKEGERIFGFFSPELDTLSLDETAPSKGREYDARPHFPSLLKLGSKKIKIKIVF